MTDVRSDASLSDNPLDAAARRLTVAVEGLERRLGLGSDATGDLFVSSAFGADRQRLTDELDEAQARVRELETAAAAAALAVDQAIAEVRAALAATAQHGAGDAGLGAHVPGEEG